MPPPRPDRTGLLILRVWTEGAAPDGFRARVIDCPDLLADGHEAALFGSPEQVEAYVRRWLAAFGSPR
jgi:hypothetical protein